MCKGGWVETSDEDYDCAHAILLLSFKRGNSAFARESFLPQRIPFCVEKMWTLHQQGSPRASLADSAVEKVGGVSVSVCHIDLWTVGVSVYYKGTVLSCQDFGTNSPKFHIPPAYRRK